MCSPIDRSRTIEAIIRRWTQVRLPLAKALATDGKRLRNALHNRDRRYETVTLADHDTGDPFAVLNIRDNKDETAATQELLQCCDTTGKIITVDALHTTQKQRPSSYRPPTISLP